MPPSPHLEVHSCVVIQSWKCLGASYTGLLYHVKQLRILWKPSSKQGVKVWFSCLPSAVQCHCLGVCQGPSWIVCWGPSWVVFCMVLEKDLAWCLCHCLQCVPAVGTLLCSSLLFTDLFPHSCTTALNPYTHTPPPLPPCFLPSAHPLLIVSLHWTRITTCVNKCFCILKLILSVV